MESEIECPRYIYSGRTVYQVIRPLGISMDGDYMEYECLKPRPGLGFSLYAVGIKIFPTPSRKKNIPKIRELSYQKFEQNEGWYGKPKKKRG